jgi:hypothetical protein
MARRAACSPPQREERFMERFEAHEIGLDGVSESTGDENRGKAVDHDKSETTSVHAK